MAHSPISSMQPSPAAAVVAVARRVLFVVLLGPLTAGLAGKVQSSGGPSLASVASTAVAGGPAKTGLLYLTVATLAVLAALAILPRRR